MRLRICSGGQFEETFENSLWKRILQMQTMWLCVCQGSRFEDTLENLLRRKIGNVLTSCHPRSPFTALSVFFCKLLHMKKFPLACCLQVVVTIDCRLYLFFVNSFTRPINHSINQVFFKLQNGRSLFCKCFAVPQSCFFVANCW